MGPDGAWWIEGERFTRNKGGWLNARNRDGGVTGEEMRVGVPGSECASKVQALVRVGAGAARKVNVQRGTDGSKALKMLRQMECFIFVLLSRRRS